MSDPAIEAVQRAWETWSEVWGNESKTKFSVLAAREAIKPIRERMDELWDEASPGGLDVLHELAKLVYPSEELP